MVAQLKKIYPFALALVVLIGSYLIMPKGEEEVKVGVLEVPEHAQRVWESRQNVYSGQPIAQLRVESLVVSAARPVDDGLLVRFEGKQSKDVFLLACDRKSMFLEIGYSFDIKPNFKDSDVDGFGIRVYPKGTRIVHQIDEERTGVYSSSLGDPYLKSSLELIQDLDNDDLVVFTVENHSAGEIPVTIGWGPAFRVKDIKAVLKQVNFSACEEVTMHNKPERVI